MKINYLHITRSRLPRLRQAIQLVYLCYSILLGIQFCQFYEWALNSQGVPPVRPAGIEAFLPISALLALKPLFLHGTYDPIHPAGLTLLLAITVSAFFFRKGFCGWVCPVGTVSNVLEKLSRNLHCKRKISPWIKYPLNSVKYLILAFFFYVIFVQMDSKQINSFLFSPYNMTADARMLHFFLSPGKVLLIVLATLFVLSVFIKNFWCRFVCPYGLFLGLFAVLGPVQIQRSKDDCTQCGKCDQNCPGGIHVSNSETIRSCECIGCLECVSSCPTACVKPGISHTYSLPCLLIPIGTISVLLIAWGIAVSTGYWHSQISVEMFTKFYKMMSP